jgi:type II secretion system protein G
MANRMARDWSSDVCSSDLLDELVKKVDDPKWDGPYLPKEIPLDPWGHAYEYKCPGDESRDYEITSYGADGTSGGEGENADIVSWKDLGAKEKGTE